ncbi:Coenzyme Q-binding protein coq10a, mitochondrial [Linnemannia zychae]|nr:Coenzyme Q-binding protein coq10a, mitochondrial [Linnemannia zychae]
MRPFIRTSPHASLCYSTRQSWLYVSTAAIPAAAQRHFITLPKLPQLPNLLKPLSSSRHYKDRTLLKYSQQEFYDLVANVDDYHKFLPWCTYSKMSAPLPLDSEVEAARSGLESGPAGSGNTKPMSDMGIVKGGSKVTIRHGELGIGFNSLQERYVSKVTCQEPWMVRAVSYDSKLFKELATTWRFTPNIPKTTTLEATMDQEVLEAQLLTRPAIGDEDKAEVVSESTGESSTPVVASSLESTPISEVIVLPTKEQEPKHYFTAVAVFGEAVLPRTLMKTQSSLSSSGARSTLSPTNIPTKEQSASSDKASSTTIASSTPSSAPSQEQQELEQEQEQQHQQQQQPLLSSLPPKQVILERTASPSNLATMKPSDFPSCWIDFEIEFEFASPVHASMSSLFFDQVSKEMLAAFTKRAEVLYGKR